VSELAQAIWAQDRRLDGLRCAGAWRLNALSVPGAAAVGPMVRRWGQRSVAASGGVVSEPPLTLCAGVLAQTATPASCSSAPSRQLDPGARRMPARASGPFKVWWVEKGGQRHDRSMRLDDPLPSEEICDAALEYQQRIKAHFLRSKGLAKEDAAKELARAVGWVSLWWQKLPEEIPRPREVPPYVSEYNLRMLQLGVEPFRPAVLRRRFVEDTDGLYLECAQQMPWRQAVFRKRNYETGEVTVTNIASSRQDCAYPGLHTGIPRLDEALERVRREFDIQDPRAYLLNNFYPDGNTSIAPHNHDFWSAILSFGASRVFTLDGAPILLGDGDLLVLGTQRHGLPKMPAVKEGRVSIAIFWFQEHKQELASKTHSGGTDFQDERDDSVCAQCGLQTILLQESLDGQSYCSECWQKWQPMQSASAEVGDFQAGAAESDDDFLAAALELSLKEY